MTTATRTETHSKTPAFVRDAVTIGVMGIAMATGACLGLIALLLAA